MWYKNIAGRFFGLVTKHACDGRTDGQTDRLTDGQNYDSQDRASIACAVKIRTVKIYVRVVLLYIIPVCRCLSVFYFYWASA